MHCTAQAFGYCPIRSNAILDNFATETTHPTGYVQASQVRHVQYNCNMMMEKHRETGTLFSHACLEGFEGVIVYARKSGITPSPSPYQTQRTKLSSENAILRNLQLRRNGLRSRKYIWRLYVHTSRKQNGHGSSHTDSVT